MALVSSLSQSRSESIHCSPKHAPIATFDTDISSKTPSPFATKPSPRSIELMATLNLTPFPIEVISQVDGVSHFEYQFSRSHSPSIYSVPIEQPLEPETMNNESVLKTQQPLTERFKWFVVFLTFVINFIIEGLQFSVSVFLVPFKKEFNSNTSEAAWIIGMFLAMPHLGAPVASCLVNRYGCRKIVIIGSLVTSLGVGLSSQVNSLAMIFITYGVIGGFGLGMIDVASNVILTQYFKKNLSLVSGISVCGTGIGTLILVPTIDILLNEYGWRSTNIICAGIYFSLILCGMFFRPIPDQNISDESDSVDSMILPIISPEDKWHNRLHKYATKIAKSVVDPLYYKGFKIFAASNFIFYLCNDVPFVYPLVSAAKSTWFIIIISLSNVVGQIGFGWLGDKKGFRTELLYAVSVELCGFSVLIIPLVQNDIIPVYVAASSFGFFLSGNYALTNTIIKKQLPDSELKDDELTKEERVKMDENFSNSYGLLLFIQGIGNLFGPPLAGSLIDYNAKADMAYYLGGVAIIVSGLIMKSVTIYDCFHGKKNCDSSNRGGANIN